MALFFTGLTFCHFVLLKRNKMKTLNTPTAKRNHPQAGRLFFTAIVALFLFGCQKEMVNPVNAPAILVTAPINMGNLQVADTKVVLLQGNENLKATTLRWEASANTSYTIEAAPYGANFTDMVELGTTDQTKIDLTVKDLNKAALLMVAAGTNGMIELRVKANMGKNDPAYTAPVALQVTTYQPYKEYELPNLMHVPGTYNDWNISCASKIVNTHNDGEYEGFINFTNNYTQFLLVKDVSWNPLTTYYNIGNDKLGFKGAIFNNYGGTGIYQIKVNTNTNNWYCNKISSFGLHGSAVKTNTEKDPEMSYDAANITWTATTELSAGNFRIRANNNDAVNYGKTMVNGYLVPDAKGADFTIANAGTYKIVLNLKLAGNYTCTVVRVNSN
jgi:hypothetical protein